MSAQSSYSVYSKIGLRSSFDLKVKEDVLVSRKIASVEKISEYTAKHLSDAWGDYCSLLKVIEEPFEGFSALDREIITIVKNISFPLHDIKKMDQLRKLCNQAYIQNFIAAVYAKSDKIIENRTGIDPAHPLNDEIKGLDCRVSAEVQNAEKILLRIYERSFLHDIPRIKELALRSKHGKQSTSHQSLVNGIVEEWIEQISPHEDRKVAVETFQRFKILLSTLPLCMGIFRRNLDQAFDYFTDEVYKNGLRVISKEDDICLKQTGLSQEFIKVVDAIPSPEDLEGLVNQRSDPHYHDKLNKLIGRCEVLERKLEHHLLHPEIAAIYSSSCSVHCKCIEKIDNKNRHENQVITLKRKTNLWLKYSIEKGCSSVALDQSLYGKLLSYFSRKTH